MINLARRRVLLGIASSSAVFASGRATGTSHPAVSNMAELQAFRPARAEQVDVLGFHSPGDGGGGAFRWRPGAVDEPITGMVVASRVVSGRWVREDESEVTDRMAGARIDGRTIDDGALQALAKWVMRSSCRRVVFGDGVRRVLAPEARTTPFHVRGVDDLVLVLDDCEFQIAADQQTGTGTVFDFRSCQRVRTIGTPRFRGNLSVEAIRRTTGFTGSWAMQFQDNCSFADVSVDCEGMGGTINFHRFPRICVDASTHPVVVESGRGYRRGDEIRLTAIGVPATVQPTWRVDQVGPEGRITRLVLIERGEFPHDRARAGLRTREMGLPAVGGSGTGVKIIPYLADLDATTLGNKSRSIRCTARAVRCIYGLHWIYGVDDSQFLVDADYVFRAFTCYGGNWRNRGTIRQRNTCADSFAGGSAMGLGYEMEVKLVQLPTSATAFWFSGSQCRVSFSSGLPARCILDLELAVDLPAGRNEAGALLEVEKAALDGTDVIHSRGHIGEFTIRGRVRGRGKGRSGLRENAIIGTNYDIPRRHTLASVSLGASPMDSTLLAAAISSSTWPRSSGSRSAMSGQMARCAPIRAAKDLGVPSGRLSQSTQMRVSVAWKSVELTKAWRCAPISPALRKLSRRQPPLIRKDLRE